MNQQQHEVVIKQLTPEFLDDDALNRADWVKELDSVFVGTGGLSVIVGDRDCLMLDSEHRRWHYYQLPSSLRSYILERDSTRLWGIVSNGKLVTLDLHSGEWTEFQCYVDYQSILYAEENTVIAQCGDILTIDVLRLQDDNLRRITNIPIPSRLGSKAITSTFYPEKKQFFVLEKEGSDYHIILQTLDWDGQSKVIFDGQECMLFFSPPFAVILDKRRREIAYADLRKDPVKQERIDPRFIKSEWMGWRWELVNSFAFDNSLIAVLSAWYDRKWHMAIVRLGEEPEVLYEGRFSEQKKFFELSLKFNFRLLGRFLTLGDEWAYDLVARREVHDVSWSTLLRQAVHDKAKQQQAAHTTTTLMLTQACESLDVNTFKVFLRTSPSCLAEVEKNYLGDAISSSRGSSLFIRSSAPSSAPMVYLMPKRIDQLYLSPVLNHKWIRFTFDDQERVWVCDEYGEHVAVTNPDKQEGLGFILPRRLSLWIERVVAIAAYDNSLAIARNNELNIYRYKGNSLEEISSWKSKSRIVGIKFDIEKRGWWILTYIQNSCSYELRYLSLNEKLSAPKKVERIENERRTGSIVAVLGEHPKKVYFVYGNARECELHYTLDPHKGWDKISLQNIIQKENNSLEPIAMSSNGDSVFALVSIKDAYLLIRSRANNVELISAFRQRLDGPWLTEVKFARWGDWLVLYGKKPLVFNQAYADHAMITEVPENKGILFFHLHNNWFYETPFVPYSLTDTLRRMLSSRVERLPKSFS